MFLAVEAEYDGPHLEADGRVTKEFMQNLLPHFEKEKKLHKKYAYQIILQILPLLKSLPTLIDITVPPVSFIRIFICKKKLSF